MSDEGNHAEALQLGHIPRTGEALADRIVTAIAVGEFLPGERLPPERELAELVGVSRSTVRDALARVVSLALLEIRRGRGGGAFVRHPWGATTGQAVRKILEPEWKALEQVMDLRHLVEAMVARTAAERRSAADVAAITAALAAYEQPANLRDAQAADVRLRRSNFGEPKQPASRSDDAQGRHGSVDVAVHRPLPDGLKMVAGQLPFAVLWTGKKVELR